MERFCVFVSHFFVVLNKLAKMMQHLINLFVFVGGGRHSSSVVSGSKTNVVHAFLTCYLFVALFCPFWAPFWSHLGSQVRYYTPFWSPKWPKQAL